MHALRAFYVIHVPQFTCYIAEIFRDTGVVQGNNSFFLYNLGFTIESGGSLTNACKGFLVLLQSVSIVTLYFFMFVCIRVCIDQIGNNAINQSHCYAFPK